MQFFVRLWITCFVDCHLKTSEKSLENCKNVRMWIVIYFCYCLQVAHQQRIISAAQQSGPRLGLAWAEWIGWVYTLSLAPLACTVFYFLFAKLSMSKFSKIILKSNWQDFGRILDPKTCRFHGRILDFRITFFMMVNHHAGIIEEWR